MTRGNSTRPSAPGCSNASRSRSVSRARLGGMRDVTTQRLVTGPGGNAGGDTTTSGGWAGWNHLQMAQALTALYQRRKAEDAWTSDRLLPLLAGIHERVPWLFQGHNE